MFIYGISGFGMFIMLMLSAAPEIENKRDIASLSKSVGRVENCQKLRYDPTRELDVVIVDQFRLIGCNGQLLDSKGYLPTSHGKTVTKILKDQAPGANVAIININRGNMNGYLAALKRAIAMSPKIINISLAGKLISDEERFLVQKAQDRGIIIVAAAGNHKKGRITTCLYPACYKEVISVGHINKAKTKFFSLSSNRNVDFVIAKDSFSITKQARGASFSSAYLSGRILKMYPGANKRQVLKNLKQNSNKIIGSKFGVLNEN